jgi:hypothetical protein
VTEVEAGSALAQDNSGLTTGWPLSAPQVTPADTLMRDRPLEAWETNAPAPFAAMQAADRSTASPQPRQP